MGWSGASARRSLALDLMEEWDPTADPFVLGLINLKQFSAAPTVPTPHARERKLAFLKAFAKCGNVSEADRSVPIHRDTHYRWMDTDEKYAEAFHGAESVFPACAMKSVAERSTDGKSQSSIRDRSHGTRKAGRSQSHGIPIECSNCSPKRGVPNSATSTKSQVRTTGLSHSKFDG